MAQQIEAPTRTHEHATPKQVEYLNSLRRAIGLPAWNGAKALLSITTSGTQSLTKHEAARLISIIKFSLSGGA